MEISLIGMQSAAGALQGSATWMARALKVEESQTVLLLDACRINSRTTENQMVDISRCHDRLQSQINGLVQIAATFVGLTGTVDLMPANMVTQGVMKMVPSLLYPLGMHHMPYCHCLPI